MKIAMELRRYETRIFRREERTVDKGVDDNTCVLPIQPPEGGDLNLTVVRKPCHVVAALEGAIWTVQRTSVRWLVVDNAGSQMLRRIVSKFNVEPPPVRYILLSGDGTRQMEEKEQKTKPTSASHHFLARKWTWPSPTDECTCMDGLCSSDSLPCCRGHHVL